MRAHMCNGNLPGAMCWNGSITRVARPLGVASSKAWFFKRMQMGNGRHSGWQAGGHSSGIEDRARRSEQRLSRDWRGVR